MAAIAQAPPLTRLRFRDLIRQVARGGLAGLVTGIVMGGGGGRLAMRVAALIDPSAAGLRTDAGAIVREFTLEGTIGLVIFVGIFTGIFLGAMWVIVRPWLPVRGVARYAVAALVAVSMGARFAIEGRNFDFFILDPALGQVAIFLVLAALTGPVLVGVDRWLEHRLPAANGVALGIYAVLAAIGAAFALPSLALFFVEDTCSCASLPRLPGVLFLIVGITTAGTWTLRIRGSRLPGWLVRAGTISLALMIGAGLLHLAGEIAHFI